MNPWLDRLAGAIAPADPPHLSRNEAVLILELAGQAARSTGARQFAPLATYLAGRAAAGGDEKQRLAALRAAVEAARDAGAAEEPLGID
jgi:hypothetical protein